MLCYSSHFVVEFKTDEREIELVPQQWFESDGKLFYPPEGRYTTAQMQKVVAKGGLPETNWHVFEVTKLKKAGKPCLYWLCVVIFTVGDTEFCPFSFNKSISEFVFILYTRYNTHGNK